jgi:hypothetical protein
MKLYLSYHVYHASYINVYVIHVHVNNFYANVFSSNFLLDLQIFFFLPNLLKQRLLFDAYVCVNFILIFYDNALHISYLLNIIYLHKLFQSKCCYFIKLMLDITNHIIQPLIHANEIHHRVK